MTVLTSRLRALGLALGLAASAPCAAMSDERVFAFAEAVYPSLFAGAPVVGVFEPYRFRYYPSSGHYLAVDRDGVIALLGPVTGGAVSTVGPKLAFESAILDWERSAAPQGVCSVDAVSAFGASSTPYRLCYRRLPAGMVCSSTGIERPVADYLSLGSGYTHRITRAETAADCPAGATAIDLGGHFSGSASKVRPTLLGSGNDITDVAWDGSRFLATTSRYVVHSTDGTQWTQAGTPASGVGELMSMAVGAQGERVAVGRASANVSTLLYSGNGLTWERIIPPAGSTGSLLRVIRAADRFVAVGAAQTLLSSADGRNWTRHAAPAGSDGTGQIVDVAWNGREFLAVGSDRAGFVHRSTDGATWTTERLPAGALPTAVLWDGSRFQMAQTVGASHQLLRSTDGRAWSSPQTLATLFPIARLLAVGPRLLAVGGGGVFTSDDNGATWREIRHGALQGLSMTNGRGTACSDSRCLVMGSFGTVFSSY